MSGNNLWILAVVGVVAVVAMRMLGGGGGAGGSMVMEKIKAGAVIVDVRTPEEFASGSYPGAKNIPVQVIGSRLSEIPKDKPVVVFCRSGARSSAAAATLKQAGYTDVTNAGGLGDMPR